MHTYKHYRSETDIPNDRWEISHIPKTEERERASQQFLQTSLQLYRLYQSTDDMKGSKDVGGLSHCLPITRSQPTTSRHPGGVSLAC